MRKRNLFMGLALAAVGGTGGWLYWSLTQPGIVPPAVSDALPPPPERILTGLDLLPEESGVIAGLDFTAMRHHRWFMRILAEGAEEREKDYQEFVASTGFDYTRDLDRLWIGVFGPSDKPYFAGIAEGTFSRERIIARAREFGATPLTYRDRDIYQVDDPLRTEDAAVSDKVSSFAFAFLKDTRLAFGSDRERVEMVLDVAAGKRPSVGRDRTRAQRIYQSAGASQFWLVDDLARWMPPQLAKRADVTSLIREFAGGLEVHKDGTRIQGSFLLDNAEQASKMQTSLKLLLLTGGFLLKRSNQPAIKTFGGHMGDIQSYVRGARVSAVLDLTPDELTDLLEKAETLELP